MIRVGLLCTSPSPSLRPTMSEVVNMLQGNISFQEFDMDPTIYQTELKLQAFRDKLYLDSTGSQSQTCAASSFAMDTDTFSPISHD